MLLQIPLEKGAGSEGGGYLSSQQHQYLCSVSSGGVAGTLASLISRMYMWKWVWHVHTEDVQDMVLAWWWGQGWGAWW